MCSNIMKAPAHVYDPATAPTDRYRFRAIERDDDDQGHLYDDPKAVVWSSPWEKKPEELPHIPPTPSRQHGLNHWLSRCGGGTHSAPLGAPFIFSF